MDLYYNYSRRFIRVDDYRSGVSSAKHRSVLLFPCPPKKVPTFGFCAPLVA